MPSKYKNPEFIAFLKFFIALLMTRALSREKQTKAMNDLMDSLSETSLFFFKGHLINLVNMRKPECSQYASSGQQLRSIKERLPRLAYFESSLLERIKKERRKHGL